MSLQLYLQFETIVCKINTVTLSAMSSMTKYAVKFARASFEAICFYLLMSWMIIVSYTKKFVSKVRNLDRVMDMENSLSSMKETMDKKMASYNLTRKYDRIQERKVIRKFCGIKQENKDMKLKMGKMVGVVSKLEDDKRRFAYNLQQAEDHIYHLQREIDWLKNNQHQNNWNNNRGYRNKRNQQRSAVPQRPRQQPPQQKQRPQQQPQKQRPQQPQQHQRVFENNTYSGNPNQQSMYRG